MIIKNTTDTNQKCAGKSISLLAQTSWLLSMAALWSSCSLEQYEQHAVQRLLANRIASGKDPYKTYLEICQRVLLTRKRLMRDPGYCISSLPCRFFNSIEKGFALSEDAYTFLLAQRKQSLLYKLELKALAEAVLEMAEEPTAANFNYWVAWFREQQAHDEQLLFIAFCSYNSFKQCCDE